MKTFHRMGISIGMVIAVGLAVGVMKRSPPSDQPAQSNGSSPVGAMSIPKENARTLTVFKSPTCGCCSKWMDYMKNNGFEIVEENVRNLTSIKTKYGIPPEMSSCHTAVIGDYVVEGHIPIEAIEKLLMEKPAIDGIAMPGMPKGSPGMPGIKKDDFVISSLQDGKVIGNFLTL